MRTDQSRTRVDRLAGAGIPARGAMSASASARDREPPDLISLGYVGVRTARLDDWDGFARSLLGMQATDRGGTVRAYRMDDRRQRLIVTGDGADGLGFLGWEARDGAAMARIAARLETAGTVVRPGGRSLAAQRHVADLICFDDPVGNKVEVFHAPMAASDPFRPGRPIAGFHTAAQGMGHAVLNVTDAAALLPFYTELLGFRVTDYSLKPYSLYFLHLAGGRHHSFALVGSGRLGLHHFMVEMRSIDDVGQGYDLAQLEGDRVAFTLGRHTNDHMISFYANTPSGFFVEYGWGGRIIDPATWQAHETNDGPSFWGHERLYLPEAPRAELRRMRLDAAARGVRAPVGRDLPQAAGLDAIVARE